VALTREALVQYLEGDLRVDLGGVDDNSPLFSSGIVDSFAIVELLLFLEKHTGSRLSPEDITLDHLDTIRQILDFAAARTVDR
jgi:acyl carrier protein